MVLILFDSYKQNISYDRANLKKVGDFYALTWLIFAGPVTFVSHKLAVQLCQYIIMITILIAGYVATTSIQKV